MTASALIDLRDITKTYYMGEQTLQVLKGIDLTINTGEYVAIMGPSGCGKSTLMNIIGLLDVPSTGDYYLEGKKLEQMSDDAQALIRRNYIGFVFQGYNLLKKMPAWQQVALPLSYLHIPMHARKERAIEALRLVGLSDKVYHLPSQLSGGQQQRVCIARAIVTNPSLILADEPTGALDSVSGGEVMQLFKNINDQGKTIVLITHDKNCASYAQRTVHMKDGLFT